jgi:hypothetical protein
MNEKNEKYCYKAVSFQQKVPAYVRGASPQAAKSAPAFSSATNVE